MENTVKVKLSGRPERKNDAYRENKKVNGLAIKDNNYQSIKSTFQSKQIESIMSTMSGLRKII